ncbi:MAG: TonB family protein, partial [Thermodesulfobacteriota bacterium]
LFVSSPVYRLFWMERWEAWTRGSTKLLGWGRPEVSPEEKRIREEVILKKMDEAKASQDWKALVPEYPHPKNFEGAAEGEKTKAFRNSPEFKKIENALMDYLKEKEDLLIPESPMPSFREALELPARKDRGTEKIIEGLLKPMEKALPEKPLDENLQLGIRGPIAARKILERPSLPQIKVRVETEIELTFWVLPNGMVDRAIPSVKGDAELERAAIQYLKQWRFAPLPKDQAQGEEWGIIPIKFRLQ